MHCTVVQNAEALRVECYVQNAETLCSKYRCYAQNAEGQRQKWQFPINSVMCQTTLVKYVMILVKWNSPF